MEAESSSKAALLEGPATSLEEQLAEQAASHAAALEKETQRSEALLEEERGRTKEAQAKLGEATEAHEACVHPPRAPGVQQITNFDPLQTTSKLPFPPHAAQGMRTPDVTHCGGCHCGAVRFEVDPPTWWRSTATAPSA